MIPEDLNRTIQFIVESQARLAAGQERDRQDRVKFEVWSKDLHKRLEHTMDRQAQLFHRQTQLLEHQSRRIDWCEQMSQDSLRRDEEKQRQWDHWLAQWDHWLMRNEQFQKQVIHLLNMILDRLPPARPQG